MMIMMMMMMMMMPMLVLQCNEMLHFLECARQTSTG